MPFALSPEIAAVVAAAAQAGLRPETAPPGDALALRAMTDASLEAMFGRLPDAPGVRMTRHWVQGEDGGTIPVRWYATAEAAGSAVVFLHGGGMICGSAAIYDPLIRQYVERTGVAFLSVDYRLAPEYSEVGLARDAFAVLKWLSAESETLKVDPNRIAVMGDSGGGGVAAATAILARDYGMPLARQILIYPMLDDRNTVPDPLLAPTAFWSYEFNRTAWAAVLGDQLGSPDISPSLAPARLTDFVGLAPAYIEVGELDIFRDESLRHAQGLLAAGVSCEFHLHPGAPHAYDYMAPTSDLYRRVWTDRLRIIASL